MRRRCTGGKQEVEQTRSSIIYLRKLEKAIYSSLMMKFKSDINLEEKEDEKDICSIVIPNYAQFGVYCLSN